MTTSASSRRRERQAPTSGFPTASSPVELRTRIRNTLDFFSGATCLVLLTYFVNLPLASGCCVAFSCPNFPASSFKVKSDSIDTKIRRIPGRRAFKYVKNKTVYPGHWTPGYSEMGEKKMYMVVVTGR